MEAHAEKALKVAEEIARLRAELRAKEIQFKLLIRGARDAVDGGGADEADGADTDQLPLVVDASVAEKIRSIMRDTPGRAYRVEDLRRKMPEIDPKLVRGTVNRIARREEGFENVGRGVYVYRPPTQDSGGAKAAG